MDDENKNSTNGLDKTEKETPAKIYEAIFKVMKDIKPIKKDKKFDKQSIKFRSIDDIYNALNPIMTKHGLVIIPSVTSAIREDRKAGTGTNMIYTVLTVEFTLYATDGSHIKATTVGEASDTGDKASSKAMSSALKYLCMQISMIPTGESKSDEPPPPINEKPPCCVECGVIFEPCEYNGKQYSAVDAYHIAIQTRGKPVCRACHEKEQNKS